MKHWFTKTRGTKVNVVVFSIVAGLLFPAMGMARGASENGDAPGEIGIEASMLESAGALEFGPDNALFVGDSIGSQVVAFAIADEPTVTPDGASPIFVENIDGTLAAVLGTTPDQIAINDIVAHPVSQNVYLSVHRGLGPDAVPLVARALNGSGEIQVLPLASYEADVLTIPNAPTEDARLQFGQSTRVFAITDLHYYDDELFISGVSNEEFASTLRRANYPFDETVTSTSLEIFHAVHNQFETQAPIVTMETYEHDGEIYLLAAYTCTPLVRFNLDDLTDGEHVVGTTVAEMGYGNAPLDMVLYTDPADRQEYLLVTHDQRTPTRVTPSLIPAAEGLSEFAINPTGLDQLSLPGAGNLHLATLNEREVVVIRRHIQTGRLNIMTLTNGIFADFSESIVEMNFPDEVYPSEWANYPGGFVINDFNVAD